MASPRSSLPGPSLFFSQRSLEIPLITLHGHRMCSRCFLLQPRAPHWHILRQIYGLPQSPPQSSDKHMAVTSWGRNGPACVLSTCRLCSGGLAYSMYPGDPPAQRTCLCWWEEPGRSVLRGGPRAVHRRLPVRSAPCSSTSRAPSAELLPISSLDSSIRDGTWLVSCQRFRPRVCYLPLKGTLICNDWCRRQSDAVEKDPDSGGRGEPRVLSGPGVGGTCHPPPPSTNASSLCLLESVCLLSPQYPL